MGTKKSAAPTDKPRNKAKDNKRKILTDTAISKAKLGQKLSGFLGNDLPGALLCRAEKARSGNLVKSFYFRYRTAGKDRLISLGAYHEMGAPYGLTLADAFKLAREKAEKLRSTPDLKEAIELEERQKQRERRETLDALRDAEKATLQKLLDAYVSYLEKKGKEAASDAKGIFRLHVTGAFPDLASSPAAEITPRDVAQMARKLMEAGKGRTAGKLRSYLSAAFKLALTAETDISAPADSLGFNLAGNPAAATKAWTGVKARKRALTEKELHHFLKRSDGLPDATKAAIHLLLLLGGQRPAQLLRAKTTDADGDLLTLLDGKGKRDKPREHVLPLSPAARAILEARAAAAAEWKDAKGRGSALLFTTNGKATLRTETLTTAVRDISDEMVKKKEADSAFQLRDIRRTCETMLAKLGISKDIRAQLLSHGISGVQAVHYDKHDYLPEKRAALTAWEGKLDEIRTGKPAPSNVESITRAKRANAPR